MSGNGNKGQMKVQEIVSRLKMFELNVSLDDLRRPTSELVCEVYRTLVIALMGINERELGQATFYGLENLDHPSLHEQSIPFINFYTNIQKLMTVVGIQDFGLVDLYAPTTQRFMVHIVHLLNFVKFKGDCTKLRNKLEQETDVLWERNQRLAVESENLHVRAQALRKEREEYQNHRDEIEKELKALSIDISDKNSRMEGLQGEITSIKDEIDQNRNKINADSCRQEMLKDEIKQLKSQIITNPSELVQTLKELQNATASKKKEILELNERGRDLNATQQKWLKLANKLEKRIATMQEIEDEVSKSKSLNRDIKETTNQLRLLETSIRDMEAQDAFLQQQVSKEYQKLMKMKQNFQEKNEAINASLCEGLERKRAVAQEQSESEKKLKHLELLIQTKDEQIKRSQEHHAYNKELLWTKFKQLRKQVSAYHDELNSALKPIPF